MIYVNARFLTQKLTGVQRFAIEISRQLVSLCGKENVRFLSPDAIIYPELAAELGVETIGSHSGYYWEQFELPAYLRRHGNRPLLSLCGPAPLGYCNNYITLHDITWVRYPETFSRSFLAAYNSMIPRLCRSARHIFTVSAFSRSEICSHYGIPEDKVTVLGNAVSSVFHPGRDEGCERYILAVSSVKGNKNFPLIAEAFRKIGDSSLKLYIVGDLSDKSFRGVSIESLKSDPRVRVLGRVSDEELCRLYRNARAFLFPSLYEGFGLPPLEAQACGCPVIASNVSSIPEVLGSSALLCDSSDAAAFASAVDAVCADEDLRNGLVARGFENAARYNWTDLALRLLCCVSPDFNPLLLFSRNGVNGGTQLPVAPDAYFTAVAADWQRWLDEAKKQGVAAICWDGIEQLIELGFKPVKEMKLRWLNTCMNHERNYEKYVDAIATLASYYSSRKFKMMILKGFGLSLNYPRPDHRPCGDIDIWLYGRQKEADELMLREKGGRGGASMYHQHSMFKVKGFTVENHAEFFNVHSIRSNARFDAMLRSMDSKGDVEHQLTDQASVFLPSPTFNAILLLRHSGTHFAPMELRIRHLLDWGCFVQNHGQEVDWQLVTDLARKEDMYAFLSCICAICVHRLGFDGSCFPELQSYPELEARILEEILSPEFSEARPSSFLALMAWKWRRWTRNIWKHRLVFKDSLSMTFMTQMISHIREPHSFEA